MKVALLTSAVALVVGQPFPFNSGPPPLSSVCRTPNDFNRQCCVDPRVPATSDGCRGIVRKYGRRALADICCPSETECCPTETFRGDDSTNRFKSAPSFTCCDSAKGKACNLNLDTGKGVCEDVNVDAPFTAMSPFETSLDGDGRCSTDGSIPLEIRPKKPFRCSVNVLLPFDATCPGDAVCAKDRQANANTGVCCRQTGCGNHTTCTDCVTRQTKDERDALSSDERRKTQSVCSWLTQGDRYISKPRCVSSCRNFPDKSCIVGGLSSRGPELCPKSKSNENGTNYNTGSCERRCGDTGTGRSSRINNNGNMVSNVTKPVDHKTTQCCEEFDGDYCCDPWGGLALHCTAGFVRQGPKCGVPMRGSPNNFFNSGSGRPPYYDNWKGGNNWAVDPYKLNIRRPNRWRNRRNNGMYNRRNIGMYGGGMYGGRFGYRAASDDAVEAEEKALLTPSIEEVAKEEQRAFINGQYVGPGFGQRNAHRSPYVPYWGIANREDLPVPSDQFPSKFICSCDDDFCVNYDDCCSDYEKFCLTEVAEVEA